MIQMSLQVYHVPPNIQEILKSYFNGFSMQFSIKEYTTNMIDVDIGIDMRCAISSTLFTLAMEVLLKADSGDTKSADLGKSYKTL